MANNSISRTGTFTSSGSAGGSGTYDYSVPSSSSSGYAGIDYYSNDDLKNASIFTDIDNKISITFSEEVDNTSVTVFTNDAELPLDFQNKKGTVGLTHIVNPLEGAVGDDNNLKALKLTSSPKDISGDDSGSTANQEIVEMSSIPSTQDDITYVFEPKANLSSNTTYFLRMDPSSVLDATGAGISYTTEKGFVTDNTHSLITTGDYYDGFSIQVEKVDILSTEKEPNADGVTGPQPDSLTLYRSNETVSTATKLNILSIEGTVLTYQLDSTSYKMNVAYTATNPIIITNINHGLEDDDKIEIYDVVSGDVVRKGAYTITELTSDTFSIPVDGTGSDAGRLNYYRNVNKNDLFKWGETENEDNYGVRKKALSTPKKKNRSITNLLDAKFVTKATSVGLDDGTTSGRSGKIIKTESEVISYVAVNSLDKITTSAFVNNSIVDISTSTNDIRFHIKANTSPDHNVHPFHSSAPKVVSTFPEEGESFPRKLTITQIARRGHRAIVSTNQPHNLFKDDFIKIVDSTQDIYNKTTKVLLVSTSNTFQYDLGASSDFSNVQSPAPGKPKLQISTDDGDNYSERYNSIFVNFSQSMNTSTITVANNTHLISADGTSAVFDGQDSASSTIHLSDDGFETIENCVSITASAGNSVFAIVPETLKARHIYNIKVKTDIQDLGQTNTLYEFITTEGITTGQKVINPQTGQETVYSKDEDPPKIKKISLATHVLESSSLSEITSPDSYQSLVINPGAITVQFSEGMKINSVTTATSNTNPTGTVMMSCDDFNTVVQMTSTSPVVSTTDEDNDTFTFTPAANLSANAVYTIKILKDVTDDSPEENRMIQDNVSSIKVLVVNTGPSYSADHYTPGEIISGTRILTIKANTGTPTTGLTAGDTFLGLTSKGKGKVLDFTTDSGAITSIRYTELTGNDGSIRPLSPGEVCKVSDTVNFTIDNVAITDPPEGNVVSFTVSGSTPPGTKLIYRDNKTDNDFETAHSSNSERIVGRTSNGYAFGHSSTSYPIVGPGLKTATTGLVANVFFSDGSSITFNGSGLNDLTFSGASVLTYRVKIDATGTPDTFTWSDDGGSSWEATGVAITGSAQELNNGVTVTFAATTGHTATDYWDITTLVSPVDGNLTGIDERSNLTVTFNQTMNVESINFNAVDSVVRDSYNILLSYDSNFQNTIPLSPTFTSSNNDTVFEFQPKILSNTNLQLTQNKNLYAKVTQTVKNKGDQNLASVFSPSNYANTTTAVDFKPINASVIGDDGNEVFLGMGTSSSMPNQSSGISRRSTITLHFNEVPQCLGTAGSDHGFDGPLDGTGAVIELADDSSFDGEDLFELGRRPDLIRVGEFGTSFTFALVPDTASMNPLEASTQYFLRVKTLAGGETDNDPRSEGGKSITGADEYYFNSFTTTS